MRNELLDRWENALRSGKYAQGQGKLRSEVGFCCLGVLCDIDDLTESAYIYQRNTTYVPQTLWDRVSCDLEPGLDQIHFAVMNDTDHLTFSQIADIIHDHRTDIK